MRLRFICGIIAIFFSYVNLNKEDKKNSLIIDFNEHLIQIDVNPNYDIEIYSTKPCKWFIPKRFRRYNDIILNNNTLSIVNMTNALININGNLSICYNYDSNYSDIFIYDIPNCCPCCPWYYQPLCQSFYKKIENCTTIILYSTVKFDKPVMHDITYDNVLFQLPCPMYRSNYMDNLHIKTWFSPEKYLSYENGTLMKKIENFNYNPTSGLCFNTSELKSVMTFFICNYSDIKLDFILQKVDFSTESIQSFLMLVNNNSQLLILNDTTIKIVENMTIKAQCIANYTINSNLEIVMCMRFTIKNNLSGDYNCSKFKGTFVNELVINSEHLKNGSRLQCLTIDPSRQISKNIETTIYKYSHELLAIRNYKFWKNKVFKIFDNVTVFELTIFYDVVPSDSLITCNYIKKFTLPFQISCSITIAEQCFCQIYTESIFHSKLNVNLSISISIATKNFNESITIILIPIFLNKPTLMGLTSKMEYHKSFFCDSVASKPFSVTWNIEYNNNNRGTYKTYSDLYIRIPLRNDTNDICVSCEVKNEAGKSESDQVCKKLFDADMHDNNSIQIYLVNTTIWTGIIERKDVIIFSGNRKQVINILDSSPAFIKCVSRIKNEKIEMYFNDSTSQSLKNGTEEKTIYSLQKTIELDLKILVTLKMPIKYFCQQMTHVDETYFIRVLHTSLPRIQLDEDYSQKFHIGRNIYLTISLLAFPPARLKLFKTIKFENNNSYYYNEMGEKKVKITETFANLSFSTFEMVFYNFSQGDSGEYSITAFNVRGVDSYLFSMEPWTVSTKYLRVYVIFGSLVAFTVICLIIVVFYCKKTGYAIPIIQIQNNMYKSLDGDSMQILSTIWPDPLERVKWTIKPSSRVKVMEKIGGGNYGIVYSGTLKGTDSSEEPVALKYPILSKPKNIDKPHGPSHFCQISLDCFINEIRILSLLKNCPNIIKLHGCIILREWINEKDGVKEPITMVVLEFCSNYSLSEFLSKNAQLFAPYTRHRKFTLPNGYTGMKMDEGITLLDLKRISLGIATGLQYLSGLNIIHRDLATRNILIDEHKIPKICDFGLAIELDNEYSISNSYQILTHNKALPYKILAPEALESKIFYLESDIWSFGLLLWEIFNLEKEIIFSNINTPGELLRYINGKLGGPKVENVLPMPIYADESIWDLIKSCWVLNPVHRPSAHMIHSKLMEIVRNSPAEVIRVSSSCQSEMYDSTGRESIGSSRFPSTRTSIITLNFPAICIDNNNNHLSKDEFCHPNLIDESLL